MAISAPARASNQAADWIASTCAAPSGAIRVRPGGSYVSGYFGTLAADGLVQSKLYPEVALRWMDWYVAHAHGSGSGVDGVPDDVDLTDDGERSRGRPDSTDAYGAIFLSLARDAFLSGVPQLRRFVLEHKADLERIMESSVATMQPNGLTYARPQHEIFYTIDNAQVYRGLLDASDLFERAFHDAPAAARYEKLSRIVKHGIDTILWDVRNKTFRPYMNAIGTSGPANLDVAYPDALAQVLAVYYGALDPRSPQAAALVARATPTLVTAPDSVDEHRLILLAVKARMGEAVTVPEFVAPRLCVDAAWYLFVSAGAP